MTFRRIGYIRVSSDSDEQLQSLENHRDRLKAMGVDEIVEDVQSGRDASRPGFQRILDLIDRRAVGEVVVARIDRLGRNADDVDFAVALAGRRGVTITSLEAGRIESETPDGFVRSRFMSTMAEFESRMLSLRVRRGYEASRSKLRPCRARPPFGYRLNADKTALEPNPETWGLAHQLLDTLRQNQWRLMTSLEVFRAAHPSFPITTKNGLKSWLVNPVLRGGLGYLYDRAPKHRDPGRVPRPTTNRYKEIVWDTHPALLSHDEYALVERHLEMNRRNWGNNVKATTRLLTGICSCGVCGKRMSYRSSRWRPVLFCQNADCARRYKTVREELVTGAINEALAHRLSVLRTEEAPDLPEAVKLREEIVALEALQDPDLAEALERKRVRLRALQSKPAFSPEVQEVLATPGFWLHLSPDELRRMYLLILDEVRVFDRDHTEVSFRI